MNYFLNIAWSKSPKIFFPFLQIPTLGIASANGLTNRIASRVTSEQTVAPLHQPPQAVDSPATISVMTSDKRNYPKKIMDFSVPPPGIPGLIPPGPPPTFDNPPPNFDAPPPNLVPPGILPPPPIAEFVGDDPFGYSYEGYEPTQESQWSLPPPAESFHPPSGDVPPGDPTYEDRDRDAWGRTAASRDKSPTPRSYERRQEYSDRDRRRRRSRTKSPDRPRDRDRYDRHRDRDREKRDRERRRSRSRSPRSPSGSDRHKHKKSKKDRSRDKPDIKKEKDDE